MLLQRIVMCIMLVLMCVPVSANEAGFTITIENITDKTAHIDLLDIELNALIENFEVAPRSSRNMPMDYGTYFVCISFERPTPNRGTIYDMYKCELVEITKDNLYDEDGDKMYWEISE